MNKHLIRPSFTWQLLRQLKIRNIIRETSIQGTRLLYVAVILSMLLYQFGIPLKVTASASVNTPTRSQKLGFSQFIYLPDKSKLEIKNALAIPKPKAGVESLPPGWSIQLIDKYKSWDPGCQNPGSFNYTWDGISGGHMKWTGPGGYWQCTIWRIAFDVQGMGTSPVVEACGKGNMPFTGWSGPTRANPAANGSSQHWHGEWLCTVGPKTLRENHILEIGHMWGWNGRHQPGICPNCPPAQYEWRYWIKSINGVELPEPIDIPDRSMFSSNQLKNGSGDPRECEISSCSEAQAFTGDPINTLTGNFDYSLVDLSLQTVAGPLTFQRSYASLATGIYTDTTRLGYGWAHNQDLRLVFASPLVWFKGHTANQYKFINLGSNTFKSYPGVKASLTYNASSQTYTLKTHSQSIYTFDIYKRLTSWRDEKGFGFNYTYNNGILDRVTEPISGRYLQFNYLNGRISSVVDSSNRQVSFGYNASGDLTSFTDTQLKTWAYTYSSHRLTEIKSPGSPQTTILKVAYDTQGRAYEQWNGLNQRITKVTYSLYGPSTITDALNRNSIHQFDTRNTNIRQTNAVGSINRRTFDSNFHINSITDPFTNTTRLTWSTDGADLKQIVDAKGYTSTLNYDSMHNLVSVVDARQFQTSYSYSGTLLLSSTDPLTNATLYTYTTAADWPQPPSLLKATSDPKGNLTTYTYNQFGQRTAMTDALGHITYYAYDDLGRLKTLTLPNGRKDWTCYDAAGRVIRTITNASGDGSTPQTDPCDSNNYVPSSDSLYDRITQNVYDDVGNMIATIDPSGRINRTYYDIVKRPTYSVQNLKNWDLSTSGPPPLNLRTSEENLTIQTIYDIVGNAIANVEYVVEASQGISRTVRTYYDAVGHPEYVVRNLTGWDVAATTPPPPSMQTSDQNVTTRTYYDAAGNAIASKDPLGRITRTYYDQLNRPYLMVQNWSGSDVYSPTTPTCNRSDGADQNVCTETAYDENGNAIASIDPKGRITRTYYDPLNRPALAVRHLTSQGYLVKTLPSSSTFGNDHDVATETVYDPAGNAIASIAWLVKDGQRLSHITRTYYDSINRPYLIVRNLNPAHGIYTASPPACNRDTTGTATPYNVCTETAYDPESDQAIASIDPLEKVTRSYYDLLSRPVMTVRNLTSQGYAVETPPEGNTFANDHDAASETVYDASGNAIAAIDWLVEDGQAVSRVTRTYYDSLYRPVSVVRNFVGDLYASQPPAYDPDFPDRNVRVDTVYASNGNVIANLEWLAEAGQVVSRTTRTYYDGLGRSVLVVQNLDPAWGFANPTPPACNRDTTGMVAPFNICNETTYAADGRIESTTDALGKVTTYAYDGLNRMTAVTDPLYYLTTYGYDANGNRIAVTDAKGVATRYEYDPLGSLSAVVENYLDGTPADHETNVRSEYTYDALGNRLSILDGNSHLTTFTYDALSRLTSEEDAIGNTWEYRYDVVGNRLAQTDANLETTTYTYDGLYRLNAVDYLAPDADVGYIYNALGWRTDMSDGLGSTHWDYDALGRAIAITHPTSEVVGYAYDSSGNRLALVYPDSKQVDYTYDRLDRLVQATSWDSRVITYSYNVAGNVVGTYLPGDMASSYQYDDAGRLLKLTNTLTESVLSSFTYVYDPLGNRTAVTETVITPPPSLTPTVSIAYNYDPLNRLTAADYSDGTYYHYTYDAVGNRQMQVTPVMTNTYSYDDANRLTSVDGVPYTWDSNGNLLSDGVNTYAYDSGNRLTSVVGLSSTVSFAYNGLGDRYGQTTDGITSTTYSLDLSSGLTQVLADGTNTYLYGMGRIAQESAAGDEVFLGDALGSTRQLVAEDGTIALARRYEPYGEMASSQGSGATSYGFTGEWTDSTKLVNLRARYYAPWQGRFISRDAWQGDYLNPISLNKWAYSSSNPIRFTDPSGKCIGIAGGVDTLICLTALAIGIPVIAGVTTAAWDYSVTQGGGWVGGVNWSHPECINWQQVLEAGKSGFMGAVTSEGLMVAWFPLSLTYLQRYIFYGETQAEVNANALSALGLYDDYVAAMRNPYFIAGQGGGNAGMTFASMATFLRGLPTLSIKSIPVNVPFILPGGALASKIVLNVPGINVIGGSTELVYIGTAGLASNLSMMTGGGLGGSNIPPNLVDGATMSEDEVMDTAQEFLGPNYQYMGNGRFVSADGLRQFRIGDSDILGYHGGGPHANFEILAPNPANPSRMIRVKNIHIYLER